MEFALYLHMANILPIAGQENSFGTSHGAPTVDVCFSACSCARKHMNLKNLLGLILT